MKAETWDECGTHLKICYMERDHNFQIGADDQAALALDLLVADLGKHPSGVSFMLIHGGPEPE